MEYKTDDPCVKRLKHTREVPPNYVWYGDTCNEYIAKRFRETRIRRGYTVPMLSKSTGVSNKYIRAIEGGSAIGHSDIERVLETCGLRLSVIVTEIDGWEPPVKRSFAPSGAMTKEEKRGGGDGT